VKFFAGQCDFFIGARMHSCIGSSSQGVPTVTLAYSKKAAGVMGHLGMQEAVLDLQVLSAQQCIESVDRLYRRREELRARLDVEVPRVQAQVRAFFTRVLPTALCKAGVRVDMSGQTQHPVTAGKDRAQ
jgi:polysaccharide pyruvyl transferase WcaK-like protein